MYNAGGEADHRGKSVADLILSDKLLAGIKNKVLTRRMHSFQQNIHPAGPSHPQKIAHPSTSLPVRNGSEFASRVGAAEE